MLSKGLSTRTCRIPNSGKSRAHRGYQPIEVLWDHWMWFLASSWQSWNRNLREQSLDSTGTKLQCQSWRKELVVRSGHFTSVIWKGLHGGKIPAVPVELSEFLMWIDRWISLGVEARMRADLKRSAGDFATHNNSETQTKVDINCPFSIQHFTDPALQVRWAAL